MNKNKLIKLVSIGIILIVVLYSMKRTGIIAMLLSLLSFYFVYKSNSDTKFKLTRAILLTVFISGLLFLVLKYINDTTGGFLFERFSSISSDRGSNRLDIYERMIQVQGEAPFVNWILGHGHLRTVEVNGINASAHNDWQEVLFDYGILCLIVYFLIHIRLIRDIHNLIVRKSVLAPVMLSSYILFFMLSLLSHLVIYPSYFVYLMTFWGAINGLDNSTLQIDLES